ncbi:hypothetical protein GCM10009646_55190 [Streptomyces aureus]
MLVEHGGCAAGQFEQYVHELLVGASVEGHRREPFMDGARTLQLQGLTVQYGAQHLGQDVVEHDGARQLDDREAEFVSHGQHHRRQCGQIGTHFHGQGGEAALGEYGDQVAQRLRVVTDGVGGGQQQLAAAHPAHDVGDFHDVDDADTAAAAARPGDESCAAEAGKGQRLAHGQPGREAVGDGRGGTDTDACHAQSLCDSRE